MSLMDFFFGQKDGVPKEPEPLAKKLQMPHEMSVFITHSCFDACIGEFTSKLLLNTERHCMEECVSHFKNVPYAYQQSQQFKGWNEVVTDQTAQPNVLPAWTGTGAASTDVGK
jgi:hypothetical protein